MAERSSAEVSVTADILEQAIGMDVPPTAHVPDAGEEAQIAHASFSLKSVGVESPILLSQFDGAYSPNQPLL